MHFRNLTHADLEAPIINPNARLIQEVTGAEPG